MKVYISADLEGSAGMTVFSELCPGDPDYFYFRDQMTREVTAACRGAVSAGAEDILVRDAHGEARNLIPTGFPECTRLLRGHTGDCFPMVSGLQLERFDALMFTGYHSRVNSPDLPCSHTFSIRQFEDIRLNGETLSEFRYNSYMCAELGVPVVFLSGDAGICAEAKALIPGITTVATQAGRGQSTVSLQPDLACRRIEAGVQAALKNGRENGFAECFVTLPSHFDLEVRYREHSTAYSMSFYPGARQLDSKTVAFSSDSYEEIRRAVHFIL